MVRARRLGQLPEARSGMLDLRNRGLHLPRQPRAVLPLPPRLLREALPRAAGDPPRGRRLRQRPYLRVKELFESFEAFKILSSVVLTAEQQGRPVPAIWDLACGHGLVGILLAYRFPRKKVVCVDLERRPAFAAFADAWRMHGDAHGGDGSDPLANLEYREGDLKRVFDEQAQHYAEEEEEERKATKRGTQEEGEERDERLETGNGGGDGCFPSVVGGGDFVVALHACNEANRDVVLGAQAAGAVWGEVPVPTTVLSR